MKEFSKDTIYLGVKDVKLVVRPYKTRTAFTNLSSSPPTIYLNEYLINDEAVAEYLILRELIHIRLNMFRSRYTGGLSYTGKFNSILHFLCLGRRLKRLGRRWKKGRLRLTGDFNDLFFLWKPSRAASCSAKGSSGGIVDKRKRKKETYPPAGTSLGIRSQV